MSTQSGIGFNSAQQPEIIHGQQKDRELIGVLTQKLMEFMELVADPRVLLRNSQWIGSLASLIYFGSNSPMLRQTLGEEYAYLRQYNKDEHVFISRKRAILFVLLEAFGESLLVSWLAKKVDRWISMQNQESQMQQTNLSARQKQTLVKKLIQSFAKHLGDSQTLFSNGMKLHLCLFYMTGEYLSLTKRLTGIKYLQSVKINPHGYTYRRVGLIIMAQLVIGLGIFIYKVIRDALSKSKEQKVVEVQKDSDRTSTTNTSADLTGGFSHRCGICFEVTSQPSAVPCGHVFCWGCIMKSAQFRLECPSCRQPFDPKSVIYLSNLDS